MKSKRELILENQLLQADRQALYKIVSNTKNGVVRRKDYKNPSEAIALRDAQYKRMAEKLVERDEEIQALRNLVWEYQIGRV